MNSTSTAIAAGAATQSAIAAQRAREAQLTACEGFMPTFVDTTASVQAKQSYASCVNLKYPSELDAGSVFFVKALIVSAFVGLLVGGWHGWKQDGTMGVVMLGLIGVCAGPILVLVFAGLWVGGNFLFG